jgi:predicted hydrolase (HD superfamily)
MVHEGVGHPGWGSPVPPAAEAQALARNLLSHEGTRLRHVLTAGVVAARVAVLFEPEEADLLVAAATLHDIGYSMKIAHSGFHPVDGATFLRASGYSEHLARLVAHHSYAIMIADHRGRRTLEQEFPGEDSLLLDALAYADMHSAPDGRIIPAERRLADIARRHVSASEGARARQLRAAIERVETALSQAHAAVLDPFTAARQPGALRHFEGWRSA